MTTTQISKTSPAQPHLPDGPNATEHFSFTIDQGAGARARIGLMVLESDHTVEMEFRALTDMEGVAVYHSRLACDVQVTPKTLAKMEQELPKAAKLLPNYMGFKSLGYGCTSASTIIGEDRVAQIIDEIHPGVPSSNPLTAAKAAFKALGIKRLGLLTPYRPDVTITMQNKFEEVGIYVGCVGSFYEESDAIVGCIDEASILKAAVEIGQKPDIDGVFISCTSLRAAQIIQKAEAILQKPVTASNHALAWHLLRLAGIKDEKRSFGQLYRLQLPA